MCPPVNPLPDIGFDCANEELFMYLEKMIRGFPLPGNVISDVNPYSYAPSNLPSDIWYFVRLVENEVMELGFWKVKGDACILFSNPSIMGWRTTLEFFEGKVPHECRTNWVMHKYWITQKEQIGSSKAKESSSLCRVFLGDERGLDHEKKQRVTLPVESVVYEAVNHANNDPTIRFEVNEDGETRILTVADRAVDQFLENPPEMAHMNGDDYLELLDLDLPASPSSSSDNSSCLTMSSDDYFDSEALLREIESEYSTKPDQKGESLNCAVTAPLEPEKFVMFPVSSGPTIRIGETEPPVESTQRADSPVPGLSNANEASNKKLMKHSHTAEQNGISCCRSMDKFSSCVDASTSSPRVDASSSSTDTESQQEEPRASNKHKRKRLKKYLCFMPFHFLL